jgi:hypothetical protein
MKVSKLSISPIADVSGEVGCNLAIFISPISSGVVVLF